MDITVEVYSEQPSTGEPRRNTHTAHVVFVAIDDHGRPTRVPRLIATTDEEKERMERARVHRESMKR
jgi:acyl-CoA hydrolase